MLLLLEDLRIAREQKRSEGDISVPMTDQTLRGSKVIQARLATPKPESMEYKRVLNRTTLWKVVSQGSLRASQH